MKIINIENGLPPNLPIAYDRKKFSSATKIVSLHHLKELQLEKNVTFNFLSFQNIQNLRRNIKGLMCNCSTNSRNVSVRYKGLS